MRKFLRDARRRARAAAFVREVLTRRSKRHAAGARALFAFGAVALLALVAVAAFAGHASAQTLGGAFGAPLLGMAGVLLPRPKIDRLDPKVGYGGEGSVAVWELPRAMLYRGFVLHGKYTDTLSVAATSIKTFGVPIERIDVTAENGTVLHTVRPTDLVREMMVEGRYPLASMLVPPTVTTATANPGSFEIPLRFDLDDVKDGGDFMLPAWRFEQVQVLVYFTNTHANTYTGGTGVVTFQELSLAYEVAIDLPDELIADPNYLIQNTSLLLRRFKEKAVAAVADAESVIECPRSADIERIYIITEDANRDPVATILNAVSLVENGQVRRLSRVPAATLRTTGSRQQAATMPVGWHVIDFTQPSDTIHAALPATELNSLDLVLDLAAVAGNVRAVFVMKAP